MSPESPNIPDSGLSHLLVGGNTVESVTGSIDRAGLARALRSEQYDVIHLVSHGDKGIFELSDGNIDAADLATMVEDQRCVKVVFVSSCNSLSLGTALHNTLHAPVIAMDATILQVAAIRFSETFYRSFKGNNVQEAFRKAVDTIRHFFSNQSLIPVLINGDMATHGELNDTMTYIKDEMVEAFGHFNDRLDRTDVRLDRIETTMKEMHKPSNMRVVVLLLIALVIAQFATPWLNALAR